MKVANDRHDRPVRGSGPFQPGVFSKRVVSLSQLRPLLVHQAKDGVGGGAYSASRDLETVERPLFCLEPIAIKVVRLFQSPTHRHGERCGLGLREFR